MPEIASALAAEGWSEIEDTAFIGLIGPFWQRGERETLELALATAEKHRNRSGIVQGGVICALADRALGTASRALTGNRPQVTIKLDMTFLDRIEIGDLVVARPSIVEATPDITMPELAARLESATGAKAAAAVPLSVPAGLYI